MASIPTPTPPTNRAPSNISKLIAPVCKADPNKKIKTAAMMDHFLDILSAIHPWFIAPMKAPSSIMAVSNPF